MIEHIELSRAAVTRAFLEQQIKDRRKIRSDLLELLAQNRQDIDHAKKMLQDADTLLRKRIEETIP